MAMFRSRNLLFGMLSVMVTFYTMLLIRLHLNYSCTQRVRSSRSDEHFVPNRSSSDHQPGGSKADFPLLYNSTYLSKLIGESAFPVTANDNRGYHIQNPDLCSSVDDLSFLVIVHTAPDHHDHRQFIRATWMNQSYFQHHGSVRVLFLLGLTSSDITQERIMNEARQYGDILQGDFIDTYHNLTNKGVMAYRWLADNCQHVPVIVKVDDDVIVNVWHIFDLVLPFMDARKKTMLCFHYTTMPILREPGNKWFVNESYFHGQTTYPPYCSGFFVVFTNDLSPMLYQAAKSTPFFWVDDVYLYGLLPNRVPDLEVFTINNMCLGGNCVKCNVDDENSNCDHIVVGNLGHKTLNEQWDIFQSYVNRRVRKYINIP